MQRLVRVVAAALFLTGGAVHLDLWRGGYEGIRYIGPMFLANVVLSALVAAALLFRTDGVVLLGGLALAIGSLVALVLSRTVGLLGFMEPSFTTDALRTVAAEVGAIVAVAAVFSFNRSRAALVPIPARVR
jgi:hypothetical protein